MIQNRQVFVNPGEVRVSREPCVFRTLLGSCVSICLHDPVERFGGMNHVMHVGINPRNEMDMRWSIPAVSNLIYQMQLLGSNPAHLSAHVVGGGTMMAEIKRDIGGRNAQAVLNELKKWRVPILTLDIGGKRARDLLFNSHEGEVELL